MEMEQAGRDVDARLVAGQEVRLEERAGSAGVGEDAFDGVGDEDDVEFQTLRLVEGGDGEAILVGWSE